VLAQKVLVIRGRFDDINNFDLCHFRGRNLLDESVEVAVAHGINTFVVSVRLRNLQEVKI
jgi:hypothetical protein